MPDPNLWGIDRGYWNATRTWHDAPPETIQAFLSVMGAGEEPPGRPPVLIVGGTDLAGSRPGDRPGSRPGDRPGSRPAPAVPLHVGRGQLDLEDGTAMVVDGDLPAGLPLGYHRFTPEAGGPSRQVIVSPGRCRRPGRRAWGWAAQLYATRSRASWGMGDLADLRELADWSAGLGAATLLVNPLHAALPGEDQQPSPYSPSSRSFRNPLYLRIEEVEGAAGLPDLAALATAGRALNHDRRIDRAAVWRLKSVALRSLYQRFGGHPDFDRFVRLEGDGLRGYALYCALAERHGPRWRTWPAGLRHPDGPGVAAFAATAEGGAEIRYHSWLQWLLDGQLARASAPVDLVQDLAIGVDEGGADAWRWQDSFALGVRVGAPPDEFNTLGQDWGMPPFDPWRLAAAGYQPFIQTVRAGLRHAGGLRFDHVMGLFRLYWIPEGAAATEGTYVRYPWSDLLDILALESHRAGAYVVGEDLGTVEDFAREELARRHVLSYRLMLFEDERPDSAAWPEQALAAVTTHDLPTVAGLWSGSDLAAQVALGLAPNVEANMALRAKFEAWTGADDSTPVAEVIARVYRLLGRAPSLLVTATLDDALAVEERPNMPGTVDTWPNWSIALPRPIEELETGGLALAVAAALSEGVDGPSASTAAATSPDQASGTDRPCPGPGTGAPGTG